MSGRDGRRWGTRYNARFDSRWSGHRWADTRWGDSSLTELSGRRLAVFAAHATGKEEEDAPLKVILSNLQKAEDARLKAMRFDLQTEEGKKHLMQEFSESLKFILLSNLGFRASLRR